MSTRPVAMDIDPEEGVTHMDPAKVAGITSWPTPTTVKQVQSFLGFCNFYQPFIYQFSHIARPLNELTRKDTPWTWTEKQQEAFDTLRKRITIEPVLKQPQLDQCYNLNWTSLNTQIHWTASFISFFSSIH